MADPRINNRNSQLVPGRNQLSMLYQAACLAHLPKDHHDRLAQATQELLAILEKAVDQPSEPTVKESK